jgi:hypothetical protein
MILCGFPSTGLAGEYELDVYCSSCDASERKPPFCKRLALREDLISTLSSPQVNCGVFCEAFEVSTAPDSDVQHTHGYSS